jgi:CheY-like chemotaxis protein
MIDVLVVDDDPDFCEVARLILTREGCEVRTASNGDQAFVAMRQQRPDVLVLDVMMGNLLDGVDVTLTMFDDPALREIPIVMVSSIATSPMADRFPTGEYLPIRAWISKPAEPAELVRTVKRLAATGA